jgi:formamidopyrimidine-DNA glycosylase
VPELPELEVTKDRLRLMLAGRAVAGAIVRSPVALKTVAPPLETLTGRHIRSVSRLGKVICIEVEGHLHLCIHLMLSGRFAFGPTRAPLNRLHALALHLDRNEDLRVIEESTRHRLSVYLVADPQQIDTVARLGPDPLGPGFTLARLRQTLTRRNRTLKKFLTDQTAVAGIGNCFSDEILFEARLSPFALSRAVEPEEAIRLFTATRKALQDAILRLRALDRLPERRDRTFLRVHDRLGQPCPVCSTPVKRVSYQESTLYYCSTCQTDGRELADRRFSKFLK